MNLILASRSPRRRELLAQAGYQFDVVPAAEEIEAAEPTDDLDPADLVARLAYRKASCVANDVPSGLILGCDTVAVCDGHILGKPQDASHARRMLETLSSRKHQVISGVCLWRQPDGNFIVRVAITTLAMDRLDDRQIDDYLASGAWEGKAGGFGYQDRLGWVHIHEGSESNVVGLPMELLVEMLAEFGE